MKYRYCKSCKQPISAMGFDVPRKKLKQSCGKSGKYCMECYLKSKKDNICNHSRCYKSVNGICKVEKND